MTVIFLYMSGIPVVIYLQLINLQARGKVEFGVIYKHFNNCTNNMNLLNCMNQHALQQKTHPVSRTAQRKPNVCCEAEIHGYGPHIIGVHTCHKGRNLALALVIHGRLMPTLLCKQQIEICANGATVPCIDAFTKRE